MSRDILFLSWESPYPAYGGAPLRTLGLLKELSKSYSVHLIVLTSRGLSSIQQEELSRYTCSITCVPMAGSTLSDKLRIMRSMLSRRIPYHCAVADLSFLNTTTVRTQILTFEGVVYASFSHWSVLVKEKSASNWILDQHNADIHFWDVYATQSTKLLHKLGARVNAWLAGQHFPSIYPKVGHVIAVCEEDRQLTLAVAPDTKVDVLENGVDCSYLVPNRKLREVGTPPRLLFTGTSAERNVTALRQFVRNVWPLVKADLPDVELWIAGNFKPEAQTEFEVHRGIHFTGKVKDMRPFFNQSDVFISPFEETHGSKLKIAEAMAMGMPIVSTPEGIRGFALVNNQSALVARDAEEFSAHCLTLLRCPERRAALGQAAREVALATIDWQVLGAKLNRIMENVFSNLEQIDRGSTIA